MTTEAPFTEAEIAEWARTGKMPKHMAPGRPRAPQPVKERRARSLVKPIEVAKNLCKGCGLEVGTVVNRGGKDDRLVRHDVVETAGGVLGISWTANCRDGRLTTLPGHGDMVWEVVTVVRQ